MKKGLLTLAAALTVIAASAQDLKSIREIAQSKKIHVTEASVTTKKHEFSAGKVSDVKNSKRSLKDGVFYARPEGSFWLAGQYTGGSYEYLVVPPYTDVTFLNGCTAKDQAKWTMGENAVDQNADENNNLIMSYDKPKYGYVSLLPTITVGATSYTAGEYMYVTDSVPSMLHPFNYLKGGLYNGFSNGSSAFTNALDAFDFDDDGKDDYFKAWGFRQYFPKPITPLVLHEVSTYITTNDKNFKAEKLKAVFNKVTRDEKGNKVVGDVIAIMDCTEAEVDQEPLDGTDNLYWGGLTFACQEEDEFGTPTAVPVLLNEEYALSITGVNEESALINFYFTDQAGSDEEFETWASPTYILCADLEGNHIAMPNGNGLSYYGTSNGNYCYNFALYFYGEMDGLSVYSADNTNQLLAADEGGEALALVEGDTEGSVAYLFTNYPMFAGEDFSGYYGFEGIPEWAQIQIDDTYYEYGRGAQNETRGLNLVWFNVEPLPAGVTGRMATVIVKSAFGISAKDPIFILQGDAEVPTGVKAIKFNAEGKYVGSYNMNGQRINGNQKGLVIKDGKKYINK